MADAELLLTIDGADVTADVWQWASVNLTDSWNSHPTLSFTLHQPFGAVTAVQAYSDVRLVNLLTGAVPFEGIVAPGELVQSDVDPSWVDTQVSCVGYQALFDSALLAAAYTIPVAAGWDESPAAVDVIAALVRSAFANYRVWMDVSWHDYDSGTWPYLVFANVITGATWAQWSSLSAAINGVMDRLLLVEAGYASGSYLHPHVAKMIPGMGLVLVAPDKAVRGAAPVTLTAASFGRPAQAAAVIDSSSVASSVVTSDADFVWPPTDVRAGGGALWDATNGYVVIRDTMATADVRPYLYFGSGSVSEYYRITSPQMPHDVLVGHSITFDTARLGSVSGVVQSISTTFSDGFYDQTAQAWPYFLDAGLSLDAGWNLDASNTSTIPRRMRTTTMTIAATASSGEARPFVRRLRKSRAL